MCDATHRSVDEGWANPGDGRTSLTAGMSKPFKMVVEIDRKPTVDDPKGSYRWVSSDGLYWGCWYVGETWYGSKFVASADPRDGLPW